MQYDKAHKTTPPLMTIEPSDCKSFFYNFHQACEVGNSSEQLVIILSKALKGK